MKIKITVLSLLISATGFAATSAYDVQDSASQRLNNPAVHRKTADEQGLSKADTEVTRQVRQAIMKDPSLSMAAQNIKIITVDGQVTLRGALSSTAEIDSVVRKARGVAGVTNVSNQINRTTK